jgi:hypothetical protein
MARHSALPKTKRRRPSASASQIGAGGQVDMVTDGGPFVHLGKGDADESHDTAMDTTHDHGDEDEHEEHDSEAESDDGGGIVPGEVAAKGIIEWLRKNGHGGAQNYSVGVTDDDDLIISRVGGMTSKAARSITAKDDDPTTLEDYIKSQGYDTGRSISLARKFNAGVPASNHAEMCIMAAAGKGRIKFMDCTGPHCAFCSALMKNDGVEPGNETGGPHQTGWVHPFERVGYGNQLATKVQDQVAELAKLPVTFDKTTKVTQGQVLVTPPGGSMEAWL